MNGTATGGKNFKTVFAVAEGKGAYEMGLISPSARLAYMCKGADDLTARRYGGRRAKGGQGPVAFKRAGVAQCLCLKAAVEFSGADIRGAA